MWCCRKFYFRSNFPSKRTRRVGHHLCLSYGYVRVISCVCCSKSRCELHNKVIFHTRFCHRIIVKQIQMEVGWGVRNYFDVYTDQFLNNHHFLYFRPSCTTSYTTTLFW